MESNMNAAAGQAIAKLAEDFAKYAFSRAKEFFGDLTKECAVDFGNAYKEYLERTYRQYSKVKTLLYRHEPKDIYSFYECVGLRSGGEVIDAASVQNILDKGHKILITGTGGIGKSIMLKHFYLNCVCSPTLFLIPVLIELRGLNSGEYKAGGFEDYLYSCLCTHGFTLERKYFTYSLETGKYLFLLDGFDELRGKLNTRVQADIIDFCAKYADNYVIVSSRPQYRFIGWTDFCELAAMPLNKAQALSLVSKLSYEEPLKQKFYEDLDKSLYEKYKSFASNPLLLTIMLLTYENSVTIPDNLNDFYEQAFTALFHTHDATKGAYKRDIRSGLSYEEFKKAFSYICFKSFFKSDFEFSGATLAEYIWEAQKKVLPHRSFSAYDYIQDLTESVCMLVAEGLKYKFAHRSFQEYFAALYTTQLSDENQKKLLLPWVRENAFGRYFSSFLRMLSELQKERYENNVLLPVLEELGRVHAENGSKLEESFRLIHGRVRIDKDDSGKYRLGFGIVNPYLEEVVTLVCKHFGFSYERQDEAALQRAAKKLYMAFPDEELPGDCVFDLDSARKAGLMQEANLCSRWAMERIAFALSCIERFHLGEPIRKRKFESVLDEL